MVRMLLGGVINFIMKDGFSGTRLYGRVASLPTKPLGEGRRLDMAGVWGAEFFQGVSYRNFTVSAK